MSRRRKGTTDLSFREQQILELIFLGKTNSEIGQIINLSPLTIKNHIQHILSKLRVPNRMAAIYIGLRKGILKSPYAPPPEEVAGCARPEVIQDVVVKIEPIRWLRWKDLQVCPETLQVRFRDKQIELWTKDFQLLLFLLEHPYRAHSRQALLNCIWGELVDIEERSVDVHIRRIRGALEQVGCENVIETVRGLGYRLKRNFEVDQLVTS